MYFVTLVSCHLKNAATIFNLFRQSWDHMIQISFHNTLHFLRKSKYQSFCFLHVVTILWIKERFDFVNKGFLNCMACVQKASAQRCVSWGGGEIAVGTSVGPAPCTRIFIDAVGRKLDNGTWRSARKVSVRLAPYPRKHSCATLGVFLDWKHEMLWTISSTLPTRWRGVILTTSSPQNQYLLPDVKILW